MKSQPNQLTTKASFAGVWTAIATPFTSKLDVDYSGFKRLLKMQADAGVTGVVVSGTTGETPTLTNDEKLELVKVARQSLPADIRVMAGTGGNDTRTSVDLSKAALQAGADSLLIVTPPYNKPNMAGMQLHYRTIAQATQAPICLYHVPGRTAQRLTADQMCEITKIPHVLAIKEASADLTLYSKTAQICEQTAMLSGDDFTYLPSLSVGGVGVISVISNVFPKAMVELTAAFGKADLARALTIHNALFDLTDLLFCETNPCPLKAALHAMNLIENTLRSPLAPVSSSNFEKIKASVTSTYTALRELGCA